MSASGSSVGIFEKSAGSNDVAADQGPFIDVAPNHRPEVRKYQFPSPSWRKRSLVVLLTTASFVPGIGRRTGRPSVTMSSAGSKLTKTLGTGIFFPGIALRTSAQFSSCGSLERSAG